MAFRVHVIAVRDIDAATLRHAMGGLEGIDVHETYGWTFATASVWGVDRADWLRRLESMPESSLFATTIDGAYWLLNLRAPGQTPFDLLHPFNSLGVAPGSDPSGAEDGAGNRYRGASECASGAPESDPDPRVPEFFRNQPHAEAPPSAIARLLGIVKSFGAPLPEGIATRLSSLDDETAVPAFFAAQAALLIDALERFGMPHGPEEVTEALTGTSISDAELDSDLGNLPRLLVELGVGGPCEVWLHDQLAEGVRQREEKMSEGGPDIGAAVINRAGDAAIVPVAGGPLTASPGDAIGLLHIVSFCLGEFDAALVVDDLETGAVFEAELRDLRHVSIRREGARLRVGFARAWELLSMLGEELQRAFATVPDGVGLDLIAVGPGDPSRIQRYAGRVVDRVWRIDRTRPALDAATLGAALELLCGVGTPEPLVASDETEAREILEAAQGDFFFDDPPLTREGLEFRCDDWQRLPLAARLFRRRFPHAWDVSEAVAAQERGRQEWIAQQAASQASMQRAAEEARLPGTGEILLEGGISVFERGDLSALRPTLQRIAEAGDAEFAALGYELLGDLICARQGETLIRGYAGADGCAYGVHYFNRWAPMGREFFTAFEGGGSLTTTTASEQASDPHRRIYFKVSSATDLAGLQRDHLEGLQVLANKGLRPGAVEPSLGGLACAIDTFLLSRSPS